MKTKNILKKGILTAWNVHHHTIYNQDGTEAEWGLDPETPVEEREGKYYIK